MTHTQPKPVFWIVRDTTDNVLTARSGETVRITRAEVIAYTGYSDGAGHFQEGYNPNNISGNPADLVITGPDDVLKYRLGSIIWDARIELAKASGLAADPNAMPSADIQEVDDIEYGTKGTKWTFDAEIGIWQNP